MTDANEPRLCVNCRYFNGVNGWDVCLFHGTGDLVRGWQSIATSALRERAEWVPFGRKDRCRPEGRNWEAHVRRGPPPPSDND